MMKKEYAHPCIRVVKMELSNIICISNQGDGTLKSQLYDDGDESSTTESQW